MSEFMLIKGPPGPVWPPEPSTADPESILLRMLGCLRDLDRVDARLPGAYLEMAIHHLREQFGLGGDSSGTD